MAKKSTLKARLAKITAENKKLKKKVKALKINVAKWQATAVECSDDFGRVGKEVNDLVGCLHQQYAIFKSDLGDAIARQDMSGVVHARKRFDVVFQQVFVAAEPLLDALTFDFDAKIDKNDMNMPQPMCAECVSIGAVADQAVREAVRVLEESEHNPANVDPGESGDDDEPEYFAALPA